MRLYRQGRGRFQPLRQDRGHDRGIRKAQVQHREPCAGAGRQAGAMVSGRNGGHLSAHPQRHPRHLLPDGGFLLRAQALHAAGRAFRHARVRQLPHHRQGRQVSGSAVSGRHYCVRQDRHPHPCHPAGGGGRALLRLQRARSSAAGRMSGRALPPFHGQRRGACRQRARHFP